MANTSHSRGSMPPSPDSSCSVHRVVLTGGPCGGKTTCAAVLSERLQDLGWRVFRVPEAATVMLSGGISFAQLSDTAQFTFQEGLLKVMTTIEDTYFKLAEECGQRSIVLCDRGAMDCSAYMSPGDWSNLLARMKKTSGEFRDSRYDCVVHLVTAADGALPFYNTENNVVRSESPELAVELDQRVKDAWTGHPYLTVVDNARNFKEKVSLAFSSVCKHIGEHVPGLTKRKFLVRSLPDIFPVKSQVFDVEHHYLTSTDNSQHRLRRRGRHDGVWTHHHTVRYPNAHGQQLELRRLLSGREFTSLLSQADPLRSTVRKKRHSFVYKNQYYALDCYLDPISDLFLLEAYMNNNTQVELPGFLDVVGEVTQDLSYSMYNLALPREKRIKHMPPVFDLRQRGIGK